MLAKPEHIIQTAIHAIDVECSALVALKSSIDIQFVEAVNFILSLKGRLVVTGMGKSAIVGQKIVATLNSTGTPSLFMHAADAIHGDLGMIQSEDAVLCISKSGETPEIKVLLPLLKFRGLCIIGMSSNSKCFLAKQSDYHLMIPINKEADPNNLAPTASTTAQMALGDAIAVTLLSLRGFSPKDFANFHPGGSLGKQLYLRVSDFSIRHDKPVVQISDSIKNVLLSISSGRVGATAVIDEMNVLKGIITDGDIRRLFEKVEDFSKITAFHILNSNPITIDFEEMAVSALRLMQEFSISQLIVLKEKEYVGMIHIHDLLKEGII